MASVNINERHHILNDQNFWTRLEFVASRWLETSDDRNLRRFWIDGFLPEIARNSSFGIDVEGVAWVGDHFRRQWQYRFTVAVPQKMVYRWKIPFVIERLSLDEENQTLQIELARLRSDSEPGASPIGVAAERFDNSEADGGPTSVS
jgi:hypothetical protein